METHVPEHHPLRRLFGALTERNFTETLGWPDFHVTDYVSNLLVEFAHVDHLTKIKDQQGEPVEHVVEMLYEAETSGQQNDEKKEREVHRHIGDLTLFIAGVFPEYLSRIKCSGLIHHKDFLVDYVKAGKRSYSIVATFQGTDGKKPSTLFQRLSSNFELCVAGLGFVRLDLDRMQSPAYRKARNILLH